MKLSEILKICSENETADFRYSVVCGSTESQVTGITSDSRKCRMDMHLYALRVL